MTFCLCRLPAGDDMHFENAFPGLPATGLAFLKDQRAFSREFNRSLERSIASLRTGPNGYTLRNSVPLLYVAQMPWSWPGAGPHRIVLGAHPFGDIVTSKEGARLAKEWGAADRQAEGN